MNIEKILSMVDHTLLKQESTWEQIGKYMGANKVFM